MEKLKFLKIFSIFPNIFTKFRKNWGKFTFITFPCLCPTYNCPKKSSMLRFCSKRPLKCQVCFEKSCHKTVRTEIQKDRNTHRPIHKVCQHTKNVRAHRDHFMSRLDRHLHNLIVIEEMGIESWNSVVTYLKCHCDMDMASYEN